MNIEQSLTAIESFVVQCRNKKGLKKNACKAKILLMTKNNDSNEKEKIARYIEDRKIKNIVLLKKNPSRLQKVIFLITFFLKNFK